MALLALCLTGVLGVVVYLFLQPAGAPREAVSDDVHSLRKELASLNDRLFQLESDLDRALLSASYRAPESAMDGRSDELRRDDERNAADDGEGDRGERRGRGPEEWGGREDFVRLDDIEDEGERLAKAREMAASDNPFERMQAFGALIDLAPAEAVTMVHALLGDLDPDSRMGRMAAASVRRLGDIEGYDVTGDLHTMYRSENDEVRNAAAAAAARQGDDSLMRDRLTALSADLTNQDGGLRVRAVEDLGRTGSSLAVPLLVPMLSDTNSEVRLRALESIGRTGDESTIPQVEALLNDPVMHVRERAARTLERLREPPREDNPFDRFGAGFGRGGRGGGRGGR
jgi:hypothetical protein